VSSGDVVLLLAIDAATLAAVAVVCRPLWFATVGPDVAALVPATPAGCDTVSCGVSMMPSRPR
jgi:hypothetical protein